MIVTYFMMVDKQHIFMVEGKTSNDNICDLNLHNNYD